ncbi:MAG: AAA family ATPase [Deltaproteobacteria bacterium]|nr:AAA family ATPase [Deltaproteobacteria bacterium]
MYLSHYGLTQKPFQITTDPRFLWLGEKHKEALATLNYGVLDRRGFLLLTGDVGTGKTTLIRTLLQNLGSDVIVATIVDPHLEELEFFNFLAQAFNIKSEFTRKVDFLNYFTRFLKEAHSNNKTVLLIIDEAQRLSTQLLEEIRLLSNIELENTKLINIFFVGQNEFNGILASCSALRQRITVTHQIKPLTETETAEYIKYRLRVAGTETQIFNKKAIQEIYTFSRGYPRLINIICDHALLTGFVREVRSISPSIIKECAQELALPTERQVYRFEQQFHTRSRKKWFFIRWPVLYAGLGLLVAFSGYLLLNEKRYRPYIEKAINYYNNNHKQVLKNEKHTNPNIEAQRVEAPTPQPPLGGKDIIQRETIAYTPLEIVQEDIHPQEHSNSDTKEVIASNISLPKPTPVDQIATIKGITSTLKGNPQDQRKTVPLLSEDFNLVIPFNFNTNEISPELYADLDTLASAIIQNPDAGILVKGYTDTLGSHHFNTKLSEFRALVVKSYLVAKGVSPSRIQAIGMAEKNPVEPNETLTGRAANRRVEIEITERKDN